MRKHALIFLALAPMFALASCGEGSETTDSSSSASKEGNTVESVLRSFGTNLRVNRIFNFVDSEKAVSVSTDYVDEGCYYTFLNVPNATENFGFVSKDGKTNRFTVPDASSPLELGEEILKDGKSVSSFRDVYYDPSYISEHADDYLAPGVFVPKDVATTTYGTFILKKEAAGENGETIDRTEMLENFSKAMGVYETIKAFDDPATPETDIVLNRAELYFSQKGTTFTTRFYHTYKGGFDSLLVTCTINNVGKTSIKAISDYLSGNQTPAA